MSDPSIGQNLGGRGICKTKIPTQELEPKVQGAYTQGGGGVIEGFYNIIIHDTFA